MPSTEERRVDAPAFPAVHPGQGSVLTPLIWLLIMWRSLPEGTTGASNSLPRFFGPVLDRQA